MQADSGGRPQMLTSFNTRVLVAAAIVTAIVPASHAAPPQRLKIAIAQLALEPTLAASQGKIAAKIREAKAQGCRVVVFPETSLFAPAEATTRDIDAAVEELRKVVADSGVYVLLGGLYKRNTTEKPFERLLVIDPRGEIIQTYNKMWSDARFGDCPGLFEI